MPITHAQLADGLLETVRASAVSMVQLPAESSFSCQGGVHDGVRSRHEAELEGVHESSSVFRGKVVSGAEANGSTRCETRSAGRALDTRSVSQREPPVKGCHDIEGARDDEWMKQVQTVHIPGSIGVAWKHGT